MRDKCVFFFKLLIFGNFKELGSQSCFTELNIGHKRIGGHGANIEGEPGISIKDAGIARPGIGIMVLYMYGIFKSILDKTC